MNIFLHFLAERLLVFVQSLKAHHMPVIRIVAAYLRILIALVDTRYTRNSQIQHFLTQRTWISQIGLADTYFRCPAFFLTVRVHAYRFTRNRCNTYLVVVTADIAHRVVRSVRGHRFQYRRVDRLKTAAQHHCVANREVDIEVKLCIQHTRLHVRPDQLRTAVRLADHPYRPTRKTALHLRRQRTPVTLRYMLARIVTEAVQLKLLQPIYSRVRHRLTHLFTLQIQRRDMRVKPRRQTSLVP